MVKRQFYRKMTGTQLEALSVAARDTHRHDEWWGSLRLTCRGGHGGLAGLSTLPRTRKHCLQGEVDGGLLLSGAELGTEVQIFFTMDNRNITD